MGPYVVVDPPPEGGPMYGISHAGGAVGGCWGIAVVIPAPQMPPADPPDPPDPRGKPVVMVMPVGPW